MAPPPVYTLHAPMAAGWGVELLLVSVLSSGGGGVASAQLRYEVGGDGVAEGDGLGRRMPQRIERHAPDCATRLGTKLGGGGAGAEVKVAQLAGYCAEHTAYHHGEASLHATIVGMAQDFVGKPPRVLNTRSRRRREWAAAAVARRWAVFCSGQGRRLLT